MSREEIVKAANEIVQELRKGSRWRGEDGIGSYMIYEKHAAIIVVKAQIEVLIEAKELNLYNHWQRLYDRKKAILKELEGRL